MSNLLGFKNTSNYGMLDLLLLQMKINGILAINDKIAYNGFMVLIVLVSHLQQFSILNIMAQSGLCFLKKNLQTSCALFYFCFEAYLLTESEIYDLFLFGDLGIFRNIEIINCDLKNCILFRGSSFFPWQYQCLLVFFCEQGCGVERRNTILPFHLNV